MLNSEQNYEASKRSRLDNQQYANKLIKMQPNGTAISITVLLFYAMQHSRNYYLHHAEKAHMVIHKYISGIA